MCYVVESFFTGANEQCDEGEGDRLGQGGGGSMTAY